MKSTIVDLTVLSPNQPAKLIPIRLAHCLQDTIYGKEKTFSRGDYSAFLRGADVITRLATLGRKYDMMGKNERDLIDVDGIIFLGQWNDGVVE